MNEAVGAIQDCLEGGSRVRDLSGNRKPKESRPGAEIDDRGESRKPLGVGINLDAENLFSDEPYAILTRCALCTVNVQVPPHRPDHAKVPTDPPPIGRILKDSGYQGFVVLEDKDSKPYEEVPGAFETLREAITPWRR